MMPRGFAIRIAGLSLLLLLSGCGGLGGGGSSSSTETACSGTTPSNLSPSTSNTMPVYQSTCAGTVNIPAVTLHICVPKTTTCEDVPNILVDYGSTGLRLSHLVSITSQLPQETKGGQGINECYLFLSGYNYGPVVTATVTLGTNSVTVPLQVSNSTLTAPYTCSNYGNSSSSPFQPYYNGILGLLFPQYDAIASSAIYYAGSTQISSPSYSIQVQNPVFSITNNSLNNGVKLTFPSVSSLGALNITGTMTFGVSPSSFTYELQTDPTGTGEINASYTSIGGTTSSTKAFFDTGSNGFFFNDNGITTCPSKGSLSGFYCGNASSLSVTFTGYNSVSAPLSFSIVDAQTLISTGNNDFSTLGGPQSGFFDAGFPAFLLGKSIGLYWTSSTSGTGYFLIQ